MGISKTVRISTELHRRIARLAQERGQSMEEIIEQAIDAYERALLVGELDR